MLGKTCAAASDWLMNLPHTKTQQLRRIVSGPRLLGLCGSGAYGGLSRCTSAAVMSSNTSASGGIHGILVKLHESLTDVEDFRSAAFKCQDIIGDLGQECLLSQTDNELGEFNCATSAPLSIAIVLVCWCMVRCSPR